MSEERSKALDNRLVEETLEQVNGGMWYVVCAVGKKPAMPDSAAATGAGTANWFHPAERTKGISCCCEEETLAQVNGGVTWMGDNRPDAYRFVGGKPIRNHG